MQEEHEEQLEKERLKSIPKTGPIPLKKKKKSKKKGGKTTKTIVGDDAEWVPSLLATDSFDLLILTYFLNIIYLIPLNFPDNI